MRKVLLLNPTSDLYGANKVFLDVVNVLLSRNVELVAYVSYEGPMCDRLRDLGVEVHIRRIGVIRRKYLNPVGLLNRIYFLLLSVIELTSEVRKRKIDVVYSNTTSVITGAILKAFLGKKITHLWHIHEIIDNSKLFNKLISSLMRYMDQGICVSEAVLDHWVGQKSANKKSLVRIYNGFQIIASSNIRDTLKIGSDAIVVTMVGRINKIKGQEFFVEIAKKCIENNPDLIFLMVGDCYPGNEYLEDGLRARINGIHQIRLLGFRPDVGDILRSSDIYVLPSILPDSLPTTILEAMASQLPIITTTTGGAGEMVIHQENGFHIDVWDVEMACKYIEILVDNRKKRVEFGVKSFAVLKDKFSMENFDAEISGLFEESFSDQKY